MLLLHASLQVPPFGASSRILTTKSKRIGAVNPVSTVPKKGGSLSLHPTDDALFEPFTLAL